MQKKNLALLIERVNLRTALVSLILFFSGFLLMLWAANDALWVGKATWKNLTESMGSLLFGTGLVTVAWDLFGKRAFAEELLSKASISHELIKAGIVQVTPSFQSRDIDWDELFKKAVKVDLLFAGSSTWRNQHFSHLENFLDKKDARLRVLLPDPQNPYVITEIAHRTDKKKDVAEAGINKAIDFFCNLSSRHPNAQIQIWLMKQAPLFSVFRFDNRAVVALYTHRRRLIGVPTVVCVEEGELFQYVIDEIEELVAQGNLSRELNI
ncbi:MAG: hypothetical protein RM368_23750 [Nostoc sp. DedSLP03]|uniref:hypothetical protein n=1 Tax=Nostoc sp. DedSLP03 TaxID=3075400 RepID=UPI002AD4BF04|nr:hypothetical protein [Nostoc sp. DedSLP03]MDZ7967934.1 hypothetical protein [Nostoc sp. DedSLP03]